MSKTTANNVLIARAVSGVVITILSLVLLLIFIFVSSSPISTAGAIAGLVIGITLIGSGKVWEDFFTSILMR